MRITDLTLRDLRRYRDAKLEFAPGLTVVRGPNEAGQVDDPARHRARPHPQGHELRRGPRRRSCRGTATRTRRTSIGMGFTWDDEEGDAHEGRLEKSFQGAKGEVRLELDGEVVTDPARADELLAELSGVPTEGFFRSTASIRHHELAALQRDEAALRDRLQASICGADRGTSRARKKLDRALHALQTKGAKNPGRLKIAEDAVTDVSAKLRAGEDALSRLERDRDALAVARERRAETDTALVERRALLEKARQAERITAERAAAQERYERYRIGGHRPRRDHRARPHAPVAHAAPRAQAHGRAAALAWTRRSPRSRRCSRARSRSTSRSRPRSAGGRSPAGRSS